MSDGETPPPRPTRPLNYVVTEFLDDSGPPKMPPRPNNGELRSRDDSRCSTVFCSAVQHARMTDGAQLASARARDISSVGADGGNCVAKTIRYLQAYSRQSACASYGCLFPHVSVRLPPPFVR